MAVVSASGCSELLRSRFRSCSGAPGSKTPPEHPEHGAIGAVVKTYGKKDTPVPDLMLPNEAPETFMP